jgi:acyl-CoA synthetase (AMP-forming)/AMP-acid ligase II
MIIRDLVGQSPAARVAIRAPGRQPMTYGQLLGLIDSTSAALASRSIHAADRLAIVLPNGPEMAAAFLAVANCCATAPLNPGYREDEFAFYLDDLKARALIVEKASSSPALAAARKLGIDVIELITPEPAPAGYFSIEGRKTEPHRVESNSIALVLHTSGTTSRPKIVLLSHQNLIASARNIVRTLNLSPQDCCLNIMPLFHIHGLVAAILASLASGGSVFCTTGFNALKFFAWMEEGRPTWYTAVPTMHQAILARAPRNTDILEANPLRFIRSSSASLPATVLEELEAIFGCPVIEAYSMTEAAHQMTSNQLPPGQRKSGSVGAAAGPEVRIMGPGGMFLGPGKVGEVVIRGPNVTRGYENNPKANEDAFAYGWFHTGDQAVMDEDGFLRITGRLKEIINRGGEKIAPAEVDEALMQHPAVLQAVTFATPHDKLGEDVAAAIVLREGSAATERELRDFVSAKLADFKVPRRILIVAEIPKGATGKLQRIGLAQKLGLAS